MKKTIIQGVIGVATPLQAVVVSSATDWRDHLKDANLIFAGIVGLASVYLVVRRAIFHAIRDVMQLMGTRRRNEAELEHQRQRFLDEDSDE